MSATQTKEAGTIADQIARDVERAIQRGVKGIEYLASSGPSLANTPKALIHSRGTMHLYHFKPVASEVYRVPILMVMATTNRGYVFDMVPGMSLAEFLLERGHDLYMLDWVAPRPEEKHLRIEDYVLDFIPDCIGRIRAESGQDEVSIIGYCFGGALSLMYAALHTDGPLKNLVCITTPIDFTKMELFHQWSDKEHFDVDGLIDRVGNMPGSMLSASFDMLRPASPVMGKIQLWQNIWNDEFVKSHRMFEKWLAEPLPLAGDYFRQTVKELMWKNGLFTGELTLNGRKVDIGAITVPLLHAVGEHDHIVPYEAASPLIAKVGSTDKEEIVLKGGHVSVIAGGNAKKRLWPKLDTWLGERSQ